MENAQRVVGPTLLLNSGGYFNFAEPSKSEFTLGDIAHGLSNACRFAGQSPKFYSVAEHSVLVCAALPPAFKWAGLMHDATEAFMGDIVKPLKNLIPDYSRIEKEVENVIFERFGISHKLMPRIKEADIEVLAWERNQLNHLGPNCEKLSDPRKSIPVVEGLYPAEAKARLLERAFQLTGLESNATHI